MAYADLRAYLSALEREGLFHWVENEVDPAWEISALSRMIFRGYREEARFGLGFRNLRGRPRGRIVTGVTAISSAQIAVALETPPEPPAIFERVSRGIRNPVPPVMVKTGPCKEVILRGEEADLTAFPVPVWTPDKDGGPYLTPLWVTKDPETGVRDIGIRRCQVKGPRTTGIQFAAPDRYGAVQWAKWKERGEPMPAALFSGVDPVIALVGPGRYGMDELEVAGGIRGAPLELVKCETVDLEVPAAAEFVAEGEIATDRVEPEGPFGEFTGYMAGGRECPVFRVTCVTHRRDPILVGLISQFPPNESTVLKRHFLETSIHRHLTATLKIPGLIDLHMPEAGGSAAALWMSVRKSYPGHVEQLMAGAMGFCGMSYFKWIVAADEDIDIRDPFIREWALCYRVRPEKDIRILEDMGPLELDPSSFDPERGGKPPTGSKILIDATKKWTYPEVSFPPRRYLDKVRQEWSKYELPPLGEVRLPRGLGD
ncbi:MAG: UbiD family decarboxylase [Candidatus Tectomicrobia bacterium]|nr:UbiD family decarboxylase [Candidatus Tectomicrobia bacterium]